MRRVLVLAHPFPPAGGGGVQRTSKLVKYLPASGWRATVLTTQAELYPSLTGVSDTKLLADVGDAADVVRVTSPETVALPLALDRWVRRLLLPDRSRAWNPGALAAAVAQHLRTPFEVVYATGNPYSSYLLARALSAVIRRPYVLDMRDAWRLRGNYRPGNFVREARLARMERNTLEGAAHVVFATAPMEARYQAEYPALVGRSSTIINGFDEDDYPARPYTTPPLTPADPVYFTHVGTWTSYVRPDALFAAFQRARDQDPAFAARARLRMAGRFGANEADRAAFEGSLDAHGLRPVFEHLGYVDHPRAVELQRTADALVLVTSGLPDEQQAKTAEYLAAGRPVVALVDPGTPAEQLIRQAEVVELAHPRDPEAGAQALRACFHQADARRVRGTLPPPGPRTAHLTRRHAAHRVAAILAHVADT
jgi:glycosyltransferase involved in cell wall biosynthesis